MAREIPLLPDGEVDWDRVNEIERDSKRRGRAESWSIRMSEIRTRWPGSESWRVTESEAHAREVWSRAATRAVEDWMDWARKEDDGLRKLDYKQLKMVDIHFTDHLLSHVTVCDFCWSVPRESRSDRTPIDILIWVAKRYPVGKPISLLLKAAEKNDLPE